jgi:hypothetical protein
MAELTLSDGQRSLELIGTGGTGIWLKQDGLNLPVVGKELTYAESADSEGRRRIRSKPQNAEGSFSVFISHPTAATFWGYVDNLQELVESAHENKGTITYTPPDGTQVTYDLQSIQVTGMPQSGVNLKNRIAEVEVTFECLPYGRLPKRRVNLNGSYAEVVGSYSPSIFLPLAGSAPLTDLSGNGRNGTGAGGIVAGGHATGPLEAYDVGATDFDGSNDYISTTYSPFTNGTIRTYMGWAWRDTNASQDILIGGSVANSPGLILDTNQDVIWAPANGGSFYTWAAAWPGNQQWVHWALVYEEGTDNAYLYIYGQLVSAKSGTTMAYNASPGNLWIGDGQWDNFDGKIAWVSVHGSLLPAQVLAAYEAGAAQATLTGPINSFTVPDVPGQVPALGELLLYENSSQARNHVEVGVQHRYNSAAIEPIQLNAVTQITGLAGSSNTRAGSIATNVLRAGITTKPVAVCVADNQRHVGRWKVRARLWPSAANTQVRLAWRIGSTPFVRERWVRISGEDAWFDIDLGTVNITRQTPIQNTDLRIEARAATGYPTLDVDVLFLEPADNYTRLRGSIEQDVPVSAALVADDFNSHTAGNMSGKTADVGGAWSGAGDAVDMAVSSGIVSRVQSSDALGVGRFLYAGSAIAACSVSADIQVPADKFQKRVTGILLRYVNTTNYLLACFASNYPLGWRVFLIKCVAGVSTTLTVGDLDYNPEGIWSTLTAGVDASGNAIVYAAPRGNNPKAYGVVLGDTSLASSGALDDGAVGLYDEDRSTLGVQPARYFDNFVTAIGAAGATIANPAIRASKWLKLTHESALSGDTVGLLPSGSTDADAGATPICEGQYLTLPPKTRSGTRSRVTVKARRVDVDEGFADSGTSDTLTAALWVTPRVHLTAP